VSEIPIESAAGSTESAAGSAETAAGSAESAAGSTENVENAENIGPVEPAADTVVLPEPAVATAVKKPVRRGRMAAVSGAVLLVAALVGGVGYTVVTVDQADRDPGKPTWRFPKAAKDKKDEKAKAATGLKGMLLPYEAGYGIGPDLGEFGSDAELSGRQATALRKEGLSELPRTQRRQLDKEIDKERIKGMVMRSYLSTDNYVAYREDSFTISVTLSQMENQRTVRDISTAQNEFLDSLGIFRKGPTIEGHKNAKCFLPPKDSDEKLDMMICSAYEGDVLVSATVSGIKPLDSQGIARFLAAQLDRISDPGEAV